MSADDIIYVYQHSVPGFEYINGYGNHSFGNGTNNVIFGQTLFDEQDNCEAEIETIMGQAQIWLVTSHITEKRLSRLFQAMHTNGYLELISYEHQTPLWHYSQTIANAKKHYSLYLATCQKNGRDIQATITIKNDGQAYLNNQFEEIYLNDATNDRLYRLSRLIAPEEQINIDINYPQDATIELSLKSQYGTAQNGAALILNNCNVYDNENNQ